MIAGRLRGIAHISTMLIAKSGKRNAKIALKSTAIPQASLLMPLKKLFRKKEVFTGIKNLTIVTPSKWLANLVSQSYLKEYPVKVVHNGIDTNVFKPTRGSIIEKLGCQNKKSFWALLLFGTGVRALKHFSAFQRFLIINFKLFWSV